MSNRPVFNLNVPNTPTPTPPNPTEGHNPDIEEQFQQVEAEYQKYKYQKRLLTFTLLQAEETPRERAALLKQLDTVIDVLLTLESWKNEIEEAYEND